MIIRHIFKYSTAEHGSLRRKAISGSLWVMLGNGFSQVALLIRTIVLARLLSPHDFGLMGIATVLIGGLNAVTQTGYEAALIHRPGDIRGHLNTVFSVQALRGFLIALSVYFVAPAVAFFFRNSDATPVLRAICISVLIQGLANPATVFFQKELDFRRQVFWNLGDMLTGLISGIVLAFVLRSVWALVGAQIAASAVKTIMSFVLHPYRPRLQINWKSVRDLSHYGKWVFGTNIMGYFSTNLDTAVVGRILGTASLGLYQTAYRISNLPATALAQVFSSVAFPLYAKLQSDPNRLRRVFFTGLNAVLLVGLPIALFFVLLAGPLTKLVLGEKWLGAAPILKILATFGFLRTIAALGGGLFAGVGHPACDTRMNFFRFLVLALTIYPCTHFWGVAGASWAVVASIAATLPYWLEKCAMFLSMSRVAIIRMAVPRLTTVAIGFAFPLLIMKSLLPLNRVEVFLAMAATAFLVYGAVAFRQVRMLINDSRAASVKTESSV